MKRFFLSALTLAFAGTLSQAATIQVVPPAVISGSTFDVAVNATNVFANFPGEAVTGFGFNVTVGSPLVTFTGETVNSVYFDDLSGCCLGTDVVGLANATFIAGVGPTDFVEPLLLATLHFTVNGPGSTTVGVTADNNADLNQGLYFLSGAESFSDSQRITVASSVPEPGTTLIGGIGLVTILLLRRGVRTRA
jgi:hypothetical protein